MLNIILRLFCIQAIFQIERIQNPTLYSQYQTYKCSVERNMISHHPVERELFLGTDQTGIKNILQSGFDCNFAEKNGKHLFQIKLYFDCFCLHPARMMKRKNVSV